MKDIKLRNIIGIIIGSSIFSFGFVHFNMQSQLGEGGFSGITLILYFMLHWDPALMNLILNIPMFILGWKLLGRRAFIYTIVGTISVSISLKLFQIYEFQMGLEDDKFLAALYAGVFVGIGLGIVFRFGGTTGGVDIIARLVNKYVGWSMGRTMFTFDVFVILASWATFLDARSVMYTLVAVYVGGRLIDFVQDGAYSAKGALIVSQHHEEIAKMISEKMVRGITVFSANGYYTKKNQPVLYCVVGRNEIVRLKSIVNAVDPHAFVSIIDVHDVAGEGFTLDNQKNPIH